MNCNKCSQDLDENHFRLDKTRTSGFHPYCKSCELAYKKDWYVRNANHVKAKATKWQKENKEQLSLQKKEWRRRNPDKQKSISLKHAFNMTFDEYCNLKEVQNNCCAICQINEEESGTLCVDHCHKTGTIRGLLCNSCNKMLGFSKDKIDTLNKAIDYLNKKDKNLQ